MFPCYRCLIGLIFACWQVQVHSAALREGRTNNRVAPMMPPPRTDDTAHDKYFTRKVRVNEAGEHEVTGREMEKVENIDRIYS